jgi:hypothetical protein
MMPTHTIDLPDDGDTQEEALPADPSADWMGVTSLLCGMLLLGGALLAVA